MPKLRLSSYFGSWWLPSAVFLALLAALTVALKLFRSLSSSVVDVWLCAGGLAFVGIIGAAVWNFAQRRWGKGLLQLLLAVVCAGAAFTAGIFLMLTSPSEDGFADQLEIPAGLAISEPKDEAEPRPGGEQDSFQAAMLSALRTPGTNDASVTADISALAALQTNAPDLLRRYLAASPAWRLFEERGNLFATRRWMVGGEWQYSLHGYYTRGSFERASRSGLPQFQTRLTIGLSGQPWHGRGGGLTRLKTGETGKVKIGMGNQLHSSHCVVSGGSLVVEVFEESDAIERRLTKSALGYLQSEFGALLQQPAWEAIRTMLTASGGVRRSEPELVLRKSFQGGIYDSEVWANPGEPGMVYLKAFEVTKGTPLSAEALKRSSGEWIGWSDDPGEVFLANSHITVYEGDWGKHYAARFELWFVPDSGAAERKLLERVFRIEGWQR